MGHLLKVLLFVLVLCVIYSPPASAKKVKQGFQQLICRRCWSKLYRHCNYSVGLTKRSVSEAEESQSLLDSNRVSNGLVHHLVRRASRVRRARKKPRRRVYRVKVTCQVCTVLCFS